MKHQSEITYTERDGILYPDLSLPDQTDYHIGKYGKMRLDYLKKLRRGTYTALLAEGRLLAHLFAIDQDVRSQVEFLTAELAKERGIDENLKTNNTVASANTATTSQALRFRREKRLQRNAASASRRRWTRL